MISAGVLWNQDTERFRLPGSRCAGLDLALDSSGYIRAKASLAKPYPWEVGAFVELAWQADWAWWSQMDLPCERALAPDRAAVWARIERSAELHRECLDEARRVRATSTPLSIAKYLSDPIPVAQGFELEDYLLSVRLLAEQCGGALPPLIGVGSMCTRPTHGPAGVVAIVAGLHAQLPPGVRLHIYGVKGDAAAALQDYAERVESVDTMIWDRTARTRAFKNPEGVRTFAAKNPIAHRVATLGAWYTEEIARRP